MDLPALSAWSHSRSRNGIDGLIPLGSTGEFLSVSRAERTAIIETVVRAAAGRVPVLIGTGAEDTREAVALSREAEALGADGVLVIPPFYSVPTADELYVHYKAIADAIGIPVMVYNNPATANVDLTPRHPGPAVHHRRLPLRQGKHAGGDPGARHPRRRATGAWTVFAGVLGYESAWLGAVGWVAVCSNVAPRLSARHVPRRRRAGTGRRRCRCIAGWRRCCPGWAARATSAARRPPSA